MTFKLFYMYPQLSKARAHISFMHEIQSYLNFLSFMTTQNKRRQGETAAAVMFTVRGADKASSLFTKAKAA